MKVYDAQGKELMTVRKIDLEDGQIVIRGKIFGAMPMVAKLTPEEARAGLKILGFRNIVKLLPFIFGKSKQA
jgi:hypothetical protein